VSDKIKTGKKREEVKKDSKTRKRREREILSAFLTCKTCRF
jgi:hypothetical protein